MFLRTLYVHVADGVVASGTGDTLIGLTAVWSLKKSSPLGVGGASLRGGIRSLIASSPFASANERILWFGEKPCRAEREREREGVFGKIQVFEYFSLNIIIKIKFTILQGSLSARERAQRQSAGRCETLQLEHGFRLLTVCLFFLRCGNV